MLQRAGEESCPRLKTQPGGLGGDLPQGHWSCSGHPPRPARLGPAQRGWALLCHDERSWGEALPPVPRLVSMVMLHSTVLSRSGFISLQIWQPVLVLCSPGSGAWQ